MKPSRFRKVFHSGIIALLGILAASLIVHDMAIAAEKEPIKIGFVAGLTGVFYLTAKPMLDAVNLAVKEINASGGILGRQVEVVVRDDEGKVDLAVREMKDVILRKKVDAVIGGTNSAVALAESEVAKTYKIPFFSGAANTHKLTEEKGNRYTFLVVPNTRMEGTAIATFIAKQGYKTIWTIAGDYEWGHTIMGFSVNKVKQLVPDVKIVGESWPKLGETDFTPYISSILHAKPDFMFSFLVAADLINFTKQAKAYGLYEKMRTSGNYDFSLLRALGDELVEDVAFWNRGEFYCIDTPEMNMFVDKFRKAYGGEYPTVYAIFSYENVHCIRQAIEKAKSVNKEKIVDALEGMEFKSPRGKLYFRAYDHQANGSIYTGFTTKLPKYPFYVMKNVTEVPGEQTWLSVEEIKKIRGQK